MNQSDHREPSAVRERYARRQQNPALDWRYHRLNPAALWAAQERERAVARGLLHLCGHDLSRLRALSLLEVGSGSGGNLQELIRLGLSPDNLTGIELLPERHAQAQASLPSSVTLHCGDALQQAVPPERFDLLLQSTVFSSLLDDAYQQHLADALWRWLKPGGTLIWYDFTVNNPRNPDVRGVPVRRVRELFPQARIEAQRLTLAPPIARAVVRLHPMLYSVVNAVPLLRTHVLCWIKKLER